MVCPGCGLVNDDGFNGPVHPYIQSSAFCWRHYGEVLAREYEDKNYWPAHRLTVDSYAAQHPDGTDRRAVQSVHIHLMGLYSVLELGLSHEIVTKMLGTVIKKHKQDFYFLIRPEKIGVLTVLDILQAKNAQEHIQLVRSFALSA